MKWKVIFYRVFYRKYVRFGALIITILISTLLISQLSKSFSTNTNEFNNILDTGFNFHCDTTPSSFTLTIKHANIRKYLNFLGILVREKESSSFTFFSPINKLNNLRVEKTEIFATVNPPLNSIYKITLILFSSQDNLDLFMKSRNYFNFGKKQKSDSNCEVLYSTDVEITNPFYLDQSDEAEYSSMFCIGKDYLTRWCRMRNVCLSNDELFIFSPYDIVFNQTFLVPGSRPPPYDPAKFRFSEDNIKIIHDDIEEYSKSANVEFQQRTVQVTSRFFNSRMLWHNVMDCLVPTFWTMTSNFVGITNNDFQKYELKSKKKKLNDQIENETVPNKTPKEYLVSQDYGNNINLNDDLLVYDDVGTIGLFYLKALTNNDIILSESLQYSKRCFKNANIGLRKTELNPTLKRQKRESLTISYVVDPIGVRGLRQTMLNAIPKFETDKGKEEDMKVESLVNSINEQLSLAFPEMEVNTQTTIADPTEAIAETQKIDGMESNKNPIKQEPTETKAESEKQEPTKNEAESEKQEPTQNEAESEKQEPTGNETVVNSTELFNSNGKEGKETNHHNDTVNETLHDLTNSTHLVNKSPINNSTKDPQTIKPNRKKPQKSKENLNTTSSLKQHSKLINKSNTNSTFNDKYNNTRHSLSHQPKNNNTHSPNTQTKSKSTTNQSKKNLTRKSIQKVNSTTLKKTSLTTNSSKPILLESALTLSSHDFICNPTPEKPLVIIIKRKTKREVRRLINHDEILEETKKICPFCNVQELDLQRYDKYGQIHHVCGASLLVGVHGSGLIHALWLKPSSEKEPTGLVEFLPYKYTCRKWYENMCDIGRIQYFKVDTLSRNQSRWEPGHNATKVERCLNNDDECLRERCHDFLRDQSIIADLDLYRNVTRPFFEQLEKAYKMAIQEN